MKLINLFLVIACIAASTMAIPNNVDVVLMASNIPFHAYRSPIECPALMCLVNHFLYVVS
ncbi:hypothetical protein FF38_13635 [Lucilia cuprina]|uniref:Uncharacterized protein n=1 Tax=Lucilia cuprina TaxID=7375 RepID=A0A0L0CA92_LUCCU|nr:hypothetical protein FF38_13635 [Lucilia cuprina]